MRVRKPPTASVGVVEHGNAVVLVTVSSAGECLDRRYVSLTEGLPTHPYHHEGAWAVGRYVDSPWARPISLPAAINVIQQVHKAAATGALATLELLASAVPLPIARIAIRVCPELPATIEERIADNRAQVVADSVMYRQSLADAAAKLGWAVCWYDRDTVFSQAASATGRDIEALLAAMGRAVGKPWQAKHKLAAAAAIAASHAASTDVAAAEH